MGLIIWLSLFAISLIVEAFTREFIVCWFGGGCLVATIFALIGLPVWAQLLVCVVVMFILITLLRAKTIKLYCVKRNQKLNNYVGAECEVIKTHLGDNIIKIKLNKHKFYAKIDGETKIGDKVFVESIKDGVINISNNK